ncbi:MAG: SDR family oxidoreductase [Pseudomonadota bacterium]
MTSGCLRDRRILVTGGTRGIGAAVSLQLAQQGATVIANYVRNQKAADKLLADHPEQAKRIALLRADVSRESGIQKIVDSPHCQTLDGIVHCAVTGVHKPLAELTLREWDWTFDVNLRSFFALVIALQHRFAPQASVIALSSEGSQRASGNYALVGATKGGLESLCRHLAFELRSKQVRVNTVSAGSIVTDAWNAFPDRKERLDELNALLGEDGRLSLQDVASAVAFLVGPESRGINATTLIVDRGERVFR